jgi:aminopeptidase N
MLRLPSETYLAELAGHEGAIDPLAIHEGREALRRQLAEGLADSWRELFDAQRVRDAYQPLGEQIGRRALSGIALDYWTAAGRDEGELAVEVYRSADNLTERLVALRCLCREADEALTQSLLDDFFERFGDETLAVNHWLQIQAENPTGDALGRVRGLLGHPAYDAGNPNKIRSLVGTFANANAVGFHRIDGAGYAFLASVIEDLNERNPQIASRLLTPLTRWRKYPQTGDLMRGELERLAALPSLSRDVYEVITKSLAEV